MFCKINFDVTFDFVMKKKMLYSISGLKGEHLLILHKVGSVVLFYNAAPDTSYLFYFIGSIAMLADFTTFCLRLHLCE